jgi:hypothetical protein
VPEQKVDGEEDAGRERKAAGPRRPPAVPPVLVAGEQPKRGQGVQAAEERAGRGGDVREAKEDAGERNRDRAGQRGLDWPTT